MGLHVHENHSHNHPHQPHAHHGHHAHPRSFNTAFAIAVLVTLIYTFAEAGYGIYADSMSLLADAVHNLGDSLGLILAWIANWLLSFPPSKQYSYGFKRTSIIAALINAFILVATSAVIAYESIYKLMHLHTINESIVIIVGFIGIFVNLGASLLFMRGAKEDLNIKGAFLHLMSDALILVGVVAAAFLIHYTEWHWIDPIIGLIIVCIVLWGTWSLLRDSVILILDATPRYIDYSGVKEYLCNVPGVKAVHDLHIWGLSTREVALTAHLIMPDASLSDEDQKRIHDELSLKFKIAHATLQVESGSEINGCRRQERC